MPHKTTWEEKGICWKFSGVVTNEEIHDADQEMYGDVRFSDIDYYIYDITDVDSRDLSATQVDIHAVKDMGYSIRKESLKGAFIVNDMEIERIIRSYVDAVGGLETKWKIEVFRSMKDARTWLYS